MIGYELWETHSGNLLASYDSEAEALRAVARTARVHGTDSVLSFALARVTDDGELEAVAKGADLAQRADREQGTPPAEERDAAPLVRPPPVRTTRAGGLD